MSLFITPFMLNAQPRLAESRSLPLSVVSALNEAGISADALSVWVSDNDAFETPLLNWNSQVLRRPASIEKIYTVLGAFDLLGPSHQWVTRLYSLDHPTHGALKGSIWIKGGGDPKWLKTDVLSMMESLHTLGLERLEGDWIMDRSLFAQSTQQQPLIDDEVFQPYNAHPDALALQFNSITLSFHPEKDQQRAFITIDPEPDLFDWTRSVPLRDGPCENWRHELKANLQKAHEWRFKGIYRSACGSQQWPVAFVADTKNFAARVWKLLWKQSGGEHQGHYKEGRVPSNASLLLTHLSSPLSSVAEDIFIYSNNLMAQHVWLSLDPAFSQGAGASFEGARKRWTHWWKTRINSASRAPFIDNGSGLSRLSKSNAQSFAQALYFALKQSYADDFIQAFPLVGVNGTVKRWGKDGSMRCAKEKARVKTGSLRDVASVSGYIPLGQGRFRIFVAIINDEKATQGRKALRELIEWACELS